MPGGERRCGCPDGSASRAAKEMSLTGAFIDAQTALAWGLVNRVVRHEELLPTAHRVAAEIAARDPRVMRALLEIYDAQLDAADDAAWAIEREASQRWVTDLDVADVGRRRRSIVEAGARSASGR